MTSPGCSKSSSSLSLQPNPIRIANIGVTRCPLRDNPQISNVQMNLCLSILFERNLQILESSKPKQTTIFHLNRMPLLPLPRTERGLPELIKHLKRPPILWCLPIAPYPQRLTHALRSLAKVSSRHVAEHSLTRTLACLNPILHYSTTTPLSSIEACLDIFNQTAKKLHPATLDGGVEGRKETKQVRLLVRSKEMPQMVPTPVALRRVLSWVPTPIALRRVHLFWFRFGHTQVWVWAPFVASNFIRGAAPTTSCPKSACTRAQCNAIYVYCESLTPTQRATQKSVDCESLTPTQGATQQSVDCESLTPTQGATQQSVDCESLTPTQLATQQSVDWIPNATLGDKIRSGCHVGPV